MFAKLDFAAFVAAALCVAAASHVSAQDHPAPQPTATPQPAPAVQDAAGPCHCGGCQSYFAPRVVRLGSISVDILYGSGWRGGGWQPIVPYDRHFWQQQWGRLQDERHLVEAELAAFQARVAEYERLNSYREHKPNSPFFTTLQRAQLQVLERRNRLRELSRQEAQLHRQQRRASGAVPRITAPVKEQTLETPEAPQELLPPPTPAITRR